MRIGIDAKWYFTGPVSGRTMLQNLLPRLFEFYPEHEWIVFLDKKDKKLDFPFRQKNIIPRYVWAENNMLSNLFILPRYIRKTGIEVLVFQTFPSFKQKIKSIAFIHDVLFKDFPQFFTWKERLYFFPLAWLTPKADRLIATTEFVAKELVRHKYARDRLQIDIVPLGVSKEFKPAELQDSHFLQEVKKKFGLPSAFVLFAGRLNIRKNIEALFKAVALLQDTGMALVIVGKEDGKSAHLSHFFSDPTIKKRVLMTGPMTNEELAATYAMAKLFCFPSFAEGFGLPPLEAMASGVPVVVSNTTALPEVCGDAAVYIDPAKPETIAGALNELSANAAMHMQKRKAGIEQAAKYDWDNTAHRFMQSILNSVKK